MVVLLLEVFRVLLIHYFPPLAVVVLSKCIIVNHEVSDILDPLAFGVAALSSRVAAITVGAKFGDTTVVDPNSAAMHGQELWNWDRKFHFDRVCAVSYSVSF